MTIVGPVGSGTGSASTAASTRFNLFPAADRPDLALWALWSRNRKEEVEGAKPPLMAAEHRSGNGGESLSARSSPPGKNRRRTRCSAALLQWGRDQFDRGKQRQLETFYPEVSYAFNGVLRYRYSSGFLWQKHDTNYGGPV